MEIANKSQAENGTNNDTIMTPLRVKQSIQANGSSGTTDYSELTNKPKINNVELSGNKTSTDLGLQSTLVSGTNIKTINNTSLLGSGNITISGGNTYYFDGQNNAQNVAMLNTICTAYDNGEEINFTGKFADYGTGQIFQAPINVVKYTDADFNEVYSFVSDPVAWLDDSTTPEELYYLTFALALTGTWGNFTAVSTYRLDTMPVEEWAKLSDLPTKTSDLTNDGDGTTVVNTHSTTPSPVSMVFPITNVSGSGLWQQTIFGDKTRFQPIFNGTLQTNEYIAYESDLANKQDTLVSGTNIKTINSTSLLGSGDISVVTSETDPVFSASAASSITSSDITNWNAAEANVQSDWSQSDNTKDDFIKNKPNIPTKTSDLQNDSGFLTTETDPVFSASAAGAITSNDVTAWNGKQDELVSGTNIKTINNQSLLGSGNISVGGGGTATDVQINGTSIVSSDVANIQTQGTYNASTNKIATMSDVPTNNNQLTNGAGYITSSGSITGNAATATYATSAGSATSATSATTASKLGSSTVGGTNTPIYLNGGTATACYNPALGNWFRGVARVDSNGFMEVGRYIDFHPSNTSNLDYSKRIDAGDGTTQRVLILPDKTGTLAVTSDIPSLPSTTTGSGIVTRSSGGTLNASNYAKYGNVVSLHIQITSPSSSTSTGSNVFTGTINNSSYYPKVNANGVSYQSSSGIIGYIETNGSITIRVVGANLAASKQFNIGFTYVV